MKCRRRVNLLLLLLFYSLTLCLFVLVIQNSNLEEDFLINLADETKQHQHQDKNGYSDKALLQGVHKTISQSLSKNEKLQVEEYYDHVSTVCRDEKTRFQNSNVTLCECFGEPKSLALEINVDLDHLLNLTWSEVDSALSDLDLGGHWRPSACAPRRRVAVIIPYRDRESHLKAFLAHTHPILQKQQVEYTIYVVEQNSPAIFNKGSLMNSAFIEVYETGFDPDCIVYHDVDLLVETERNIFFCGSEVMHMAAYIDKFDYQLLYGGMFGGAVALRPDMFEKTNGYSNKFFGWGGEDDDFYRRVRYSFESIYRPPATISRYKMIKHEKDKGNPYNQTVAIQGERMVLHTYRRDGLNSVNYATVFIDYHRSHTRILVDILV